MIDCFCPLHMLILVGDFVNFHLLFNLYVKFPGHPPNWSPTGTCPITCGGSITSSHPTFSKFTVQLLYSRNTEKRRYRFIVKL